jgi:MoxR-like ATPase
VRLSLGYPATEDEVQILRNLRKRHPIESIGQVVGGDELLDLHDAVTDVHVDASLEQYILDVVQATRNHPDLVLGASPRGSLALYKTAQALAALDARDHVIPDDIKTLVPLTLAHRLIARPDSELRGRTGEGILAEILEETALHIGKLA